MQCNTVMDCRSEELTAARRRARAGARAKRTEDRRGGAYGGSGTKGSEGKGKGRQQGNKEKTEKQKPSYCVHPALPSGLTS